MSVAYWSKRTMLNCNWIVTSAFYRGALFDEHSIHFVLQFDSTTRFGTVCYTFWWNSVLHFGAAGESSLAYWSTKNNSIVTRLSAFYLAALFDDFLVLCVILYDGTLALQVNLVLCIDQPKRQTGGHLLLQPSGQTHHRLTTKRKTRNKETTVN